MKEIFLSQGKVTIVDDCDYEWLMQWKWHISEGRGLYYAVRKMRIGPGKYKKIFMHREIAKRAGFPEVDHQDRNSLHNWRENLRPCTRSQNCANRKLFKNNRSGFKGVSWFSLGQTWNAYINRNNKRIHLGCFHTPEEGARAYDVAAKRLFGEFALLNFPNS